MTRPQSMLVGEDWRAGLVEALSISPNHKLVLGTEALLRGAKGKRLLYQQPRETANA